MNFTILTFNLRASLIARTNKQAAVGKLPGLADIVRGEGADFVCLQETGITGEVPPPLLREAFPQAVVRVAGKSRYNSVAILVGPRWEVLETRTHDSGRAICVKVRLKDGTVDMEVVSVYMPTNLDSGAGGMAERWSENMTVEQVAEGDRVTGDKDSLSRRVRTRLAEDLYEFIEESVERTGGKTIVGGDLNSTRCPGDRWKDGDVPVLEGPLGEQIPGRLINEFLEGSALVDIGRRLRPGVRFFTREKYEKADPKKLVNSSRLDYILVPGCTVGVEGGHWEYEGLEAGGHSDHCPQVARYFSTEGAGPRPNPWVVPPPWTPHFARLDLATPAELQRVFEECERRAGNLLGVWPRGKSPRVLGKVTREFLALMNKGIDVAVPSLRGRSRRPPTERKRGGRLARKRQQRACLLDLQKSLARIRTGHVSVAAPSHRRAVRRLREALGHGLGAHYDDVATLERIVDTALSDDDMQGELLEAWYGAPGHKDQHWRHLQQAFAEPKRFGRFIEGYLRPRVGGRLDHAVRKDGTAAWDPTEYLPIVRDIVSRPMSEGVELPPRFPEELRSHPTARSETVPDLYPAPDGTFKSADVRARGHRGFWWDEVYKRGSSGATEEAWAALMVPPPAAEIADLVSRCASGKSPGHDGLGIDFYKLMARAGGEQSRCLQVVAKIAGLCLELGHQPDVLKHGWITMVPKVKTDGSFSTDPANMRPITVLPELGKIVSRLLSRRIGDVLVRNPTFLSSAQRGFLRDGSIFQCMDTLVDVIEDWRQNTETPKGASGKSAGVKRGRGRRSEPLYVVSYDQSKAYDRVQAYSIQASLERLNMPELFVQYVLSTLRGATSQVRTAGGLTRSFSLRSGVRQGDPLSPLIYIFFMDVLHARLERDNPLFPGREQDWGYRFRREDPRTGRPVQVFSCGYCDDTVIVGSSARAVREMHAWVREFFGAHCGALNCEKSYLLCSRGAEVPELPSVDGETLIEGRGEDYTIRYLGMWVNLRLDWTTQKARMDRLVWKVCSAVRRNGFTLPMARAAVSQFLVPGLLIGLRMADVRTEEVQAWDSRIRRAAQKGAGITMQQVSCDAFYAGAQFPCLETLRWAILGEELMVNLIADYPSSWTCRARLEAIRAGNRGAARQGECREEHGAVRSRAALTRRALGQKVQARYHATRPGPLTRGESDRGPWDPAAACWNEWTPYLPAVVRRVERPGIGEVRSYTDGSTGAEPGRPSGCAAVIVVGDEHVHTRGIPCRPSGRNYLAEMVAILVALTSVPGNVAHEVITDCLSGVYAINKGRDRDWSTGEYLPSYTLTQRARILCGARPVLNIIRAVICQRSCPTQFTHVRAHSGGTDIHSRMNELADREANRVRIDSGDSVLGLRIYGEASHRMEIETGGGKVPVVDRYKPAILRAFERKRMEAWAEKLRPQSQGPPPSEAPSMSPLHLEVAHSSRLVAANRIGVVRTSELVAKSRDPALARFWVLALAESLPTERRLWREKRTGRPCRGDRCKLCGTAVETLRHVFVCPHGALVTARKQAWERVVDVLRGAGCRVAPVGQSTTLEPGGLLEVQWVRAWFGGNSRCWLEIAFPRGGPPPDTGEPQDPLGSALGVLPIYLDRALAWRRVPGGGWRRRSLREVELLCGGLRRALLYGALAVWEARCRAMNTWWASPAAGVHAEARASQLAGRARAARLAREEVQFNKLMARKKAKRLDRERSRGTPATPRALRRSPRTPKPVQYSHAMVTYGDEVAGHLAALDAGVCGLGSFRKPLPWY